MEWDEEARGVFENLNVWEVGGLLLVALLIFGDRLPAVISDGLRMLRNLRAMARNATGDLSRELGTDIQLEDLHPKAFIRKHLLSEEDEAAIRKPVQSVLDDLKGDVKGVRDELDGVAADLRPRGNGSVPEMTGVEGPAGSAATANGRPAPRAFDLDAT